MRFAEIWLKTSWCEDGRSQEGVRQHLIFCWMTIPDRLMEIPPSRYTRQHCKWEASEDADAEERAAGGDQGFPRLSSSLGSELRRGIPAVHCAVPPYSRPLKVQLLPGRTSFSNFHFVLEHSWFKTLYQFQVYGKVIQCCMYLHSF